MNSYKNLCITYQHINEDNTVTSHMYLLSGISGISGGKQSTVTQYTTPSGKKISDHMYINPRTLSFTLNTSNIAMNPNKHYENSVLVNDFSDVEHIKSTINKWIDNGYRLNIQTFEDRYKNMVLTDVSLNEDSSGIGVWSPTLTFTEVRVAKVETIQLEFPKSNHESANENSTQPTGPDNGNDAGVAGNVLGNIGSGAMLGAAIGSFFPGYGTLIGGAIGAVVGFGSWLLSQ